MRLNGIFKDNIVFQRGDEIRVFGTAAGGTEVKACIKNGSAVISYAQAAAGADGAFLVFFR